MKIDLKKLLGLTVETASGTAIGKVRGLVIDTDSHAVLQYEVRGTNLFAKERLIANDQVVSISSEKMVVDDLVLKEPQTAPAKPGVVPTS